MNQTTKKHHYIWRYYLAPWTSNNSTEGQITCLRNNKIFSASLTNIAHENYFYSVNELSPQEKDLIYKMFVENTQGIQRIVNESWLKLFCSSFDMADEITQFKCSILGYASRDEILNNQEFKNWNIESIEKLHGRIELSGMDYLSQLREDKLDFWKDEEYRDNFSFYISMLTSHGIPTQLPKSRFSS